MILKIKLLFIKEVIFQIMNKKAKLRYNNYSGYPDAVYITDNNQVICSEYKKNLAKDVNYNITGFMFKSKIIGQISQAIIGLYLVLENQSNLKDREYFIQLKDIHDTLTIKMNKSYYNNILNILLTYGKKHDFSCPSDFYYKSKADLRGLLYPHFKNIIDHYINNYEWN